MNKLVLLLFGQLEHKDKRNLKIQIKNAYQKLQQSQGQHVALLCKVSWICDAEIHLFTTKRWTEPISIRK